MSDKFIKNMHHLFESGGLGISLKILLEEDEKDPFGALDKKKSDDTEDEEDTKETEETEDTEKTDDLEKTDDTDNTTGSGDDDLVDVMQGLQDDIDTLAKANNARLSLKAKLVPKPIKKIISNQSESYIRKNILKKMALIKEDSDDTDDTSKMLDDIEGSLRDEQERINSLGNTSHKLAATASNGMDINANVEAENAFDLFTNFYKKVNPAEVVLADYTDWIIDNADPSKAEEIAIKFKEEFNKLLPDESKIDKQVKNSNYNTAVGGKQSS